MEGVILLILLAVLALPVVALIVALVARSKSNTSSAWLGTLESEVAELRRVLEKQQKRLDALEKASRDAGGPLPQEASAAPKAAAAPVPARPTPVPPTQASVGALSAKPPAIPDAAVPPPPSPRVSASADPRGEPTQGPTVGVPVGGVMLSVPDVGTASSFPAVPGAAVPPSQLPAPAGAVPPPKSPTVPMRSAQQVPAAPHAPSPPPTAPPIQEEPKRGAGWEQRLGIALPVWIGAVALILSGVFLVKYSIEHGYLGPMARVTIAALFGAALLIVGEWLRKKSAMTAQGASAAGVAVLYAAVLAGTVLYKFILPWAGFSLLALITAAAVALSLRQGIVVAVLGLVGGFFTPYFIGVVSASPARLFTYLLLLQGGLIIVTRRRQWTGLAALTLVMGLGAALMRVAGDSVLQDAPWIGLFLLVSTAAFVLSARGFKTATPSGESFQAKLPFGALIGYGSLVGAFLGVAALAAMTRFALEEWLFVGILALASLVLGRLDRTYERMPWVGLALVVLLEAGWIVQSQPKDKSSVWIVSAGLALIFGLGAWIAGLRSPNPTTWATLSSFAGLMAFGGAWWVDKLHGSTVEHWGVVSLAGAILYLLVAIRAARPTRRTKDGEEPLAAYCVVVTSFVSLAVPLELSSQWLSVAWALEAAALAWLLLKLRVEVLGRIGLLLGAGVCVRLLLNPRVLDYPLGDLPVLNWVLYGYGLSALAFGLAAWWYDRARWERAAAAFTWGAGGLTFALLTLEVRQGFHPGKLLGAFPHLVEWATYSHLWVAAGLLCLAAFLRWKKETLGFVGLAFLVVAAVKIAFVDCLIVNPLWHADDVGSFLIFNWLLYIYAIPVLGLMLSGWLLDRAGWAGPAKAASWAAGLLTMVFVALEVRQGFHPERLAGGSPSLVEWATYSHAYLAAGLLLLLAHRKWGKETLLRVARAFVAVALAKIGLVDLLVANPVWSHQDVGSWPVLNWLLYIYAIPIVALFAISRLEAGSQRAGEQVDRLLRVCELLLLVVLVSLEVRQFFNPGYLNSGSVSLMEVSTYGHVWFILTALLALFGERRGDSVAEGGAKVLYGVTLGKLVFLDLLVCNPLIWHQSAGDLPIVNALLYVYGLPILGLAGLALLPCAEAWAPLRKALAFYGGVVLAFALLSLEIRQFFHQPFLDGASVLDTENYAYSAAWILFALSLLVVGIVRREKAIRAASLVVIFLAITKVFVYDLRHLEGLFRAGSFMALGLSLLLISFLFQRFVIREVGHETP